VKFNSAEKAAVHGKNSIKTNIEKNLLCVRDPQRTQTICRDQMHPHYFGKCGPTEGQ